MQIYQSVILQKPFIFRPVLRKEYEGLRGKNQYEIEVHLCKLAVIDPPIIDWDNIEAGIPTSLAREILRVSGWGDIDYINTLIASELDRVTNTPTLWMDAIIQHVYPHCTDEYLGELTQAQIITLYAKALYAYRFLEDEKIAINITRMNEMQQAQKKQQQSVPKIPTKQQRNPYNQGVLA